MKKFNKLLKYLLYVIVIIITFAIIILLGKWTKSIESKQRMSDLRDTLKDVLDNYGEKGLLEMAGIPVNEIYYSEDGITIFKGDNSSWNYSADELQNISVFESCNNAVVYINTKSSDVSDYYQVIPKNGVGSGFFVSADGYICTNKHVIDDAEIILVTTGDGNQYNADLVGIDSENDIAVIKIDAGADMKFQYLSFVDSDQLIVGQKVLAIGNPFGFERTLVTGVISGLSRPIRNESGQILLGMIQTSAPIYPGNSGGPLLNGKGQVIGVCTSVYSLSDNSQGLNFAVSANAAATSVQDIIKYGKVTRGWLDIVPVVLTQQIVDYGSLKVDSGLLVSEVVSGGKAQQAGIRGGSGNPVKYGDKGYFYMGGDIITSVNNTNVENISDLYSALSLTRPCDKVDVVVSRNGVINRFKVELVERTTELISKTIK